MKRLLLLLPIAALAVAFFALGLHQHMTLDAFYASGEVFDDWYQRKPMLVITAYFALFAFLTLFLPVATLMTVISGALFGFWKGVLVASFAASLAATLAFFLSRFIFHDSIQHRFGERLAAVNAGIARDGALYLFSLRLVPVIPFFMINLVMGLSPMRLFTYYWVTQLGMLAGIAVYANAGTQIADVENLSEIFTPDLIGSLALLGLFPLLGKHLVRWLRRHRTAAG